jgi:hypothetical protein
MMVFAILIALVALLMRAMITQLAMINAVCCSEQQLLLEFVVVTQLIVAQTHNLCRYLDSVMPGSCCQQEEPRQGSAMLGEVRSQHHP